MPKRIGKYEITAEIGRGGFSRVYRGFDPNVNRPVAIKVSTRESDPEHLSRFRNEASAAGNLRHENIVTIHDYGDDDGVPYLVMELLDGRDLHHIMRDGPKLSLLEKMQVMSQVAEGLQCAHLNGVVHRDIKPANVMVLADSSVKILDFGIARMTGEVSRLTQSGYLVGTPLYMSPEQLQGGDADALCDVWAYGVLYFELLTGQHPFLSQDNTRLIRNITIVNPPSVHSLTRGVPEGLAQVIRRALTKDRRRRYQSLEEVLVDTNPILGLLQREQTAGLVTEAQYFRNSGQLVAARQSSRRALEIDPSNFGAQQLLKSIQHDMQEESLSTAEPEPVKMALAPPPPPAPMRAVQAAPVPAVMHDEPEMILPDGESEVFEPEMPVVAAPVVAAPVKPVYTPAPVAAPVQPVVPIPAPPASAPVITPVAARLVSSMPAPVSAPAASVAIETPAPSTQQRLRPTMVSGAAAAIAAAVAAAKARQAEEEKLHKEQKEEEEHEEEPVAPPIKATPLVISALPVTRVAPTAASAASLKRAENGSGAFLTDDPLVVRRPAAAVMTQRMNSTAAMASVAAVETPRPTAPAPPPTRLPGTKAIPASMSRISNGTAENKSAVVAPTRAEGRVSENLPMRRPPSEVYSKGKRRKSSNTLFTDKPKPSKPFPWAVIGFVVLVVASAVALFLFSLSAPKMVNTPSLLPEKMAFTWKPGAPAPADQLLTLKGGAANASFTATSDEDWLVITPEIDEANNRNWKVKVDPEKLGSTIPTVTTGWIDVSSTEGFKTQAEITLKVGAGEAAPASTKGKKTPAAALKEETPTITTVAPTPAAKKSASVTPDKSSVIPPDKGTTTTITTVVDSAKTVTAKPSATATKAPAPTVKKPETKKPASDGIDIN